MGIIGSFQGFVDSPLYLYNKGVWSNLQTIGMLNAVEQGGTDKYIYLDGTGVSYGRLNQTVNLSSYNYVKIEAVMGTTSGFTFSFRIGVSTNSSFDKSNMVASVCAEGANYAKTYGILNVESLSGNYYIYVYDRMLIRADGFTNKTSILKMYSILLTTS